MALKWDGDAAYERIEAAAWAGVERAAVYFWQKVEDELGVSAKVGWGTRARDYEASRPGQPPRKRTGWLQRHVLYELDRDNLRARVGLGANALYGLFLEFGTRRMLARPWLLATLRKYWAQVKALLTLRG